MVLADVRTRGILTTHARETKHICSFGNLSGMQLPPIPCFGSVHLLRAIQHSTAKPIRIILF